MNNIQCVLCDNKAGKYSRKSHTSDDFDIYKCSNCGLEYTMPIPSDNDLIKFYSLYNDIRADTNIVKKNIINNINIINKVTDINDKSLILDFGCGNGEFVDFYGNNCYGVELSNKSKNSRIKNNISDFQIEKFKCITLFGVLEHLNNIKETMLNVYSYIEDDGYLVITTVNAESLIPYFYKPPEHLTYWTKKSFEKLANLLELEIIYYSPYKMIQYGSIYLDRLLSRTPKELRDIVINNTISNFPKFVEVPTNEVFVIMKK